MVVVLLIGVVAFLFGYGSAEEGTGEWPVLVEAEHSHEIYNLKEILEQVDLPVIVEEESTEAGGIPTTLTRNVLRVPPGRVDEALERIRDSDVDTEPFRFRTGGSGPKRETER